MINRVLTTSLGVLLLCVAPIGALGFVVSLEGAELGGLPGTIGLGIVTPLAAFLGGWLIRRARATKGAPLGSGEPVPWKHGMSSRDCQ